MNIGATFKAVLLQFVQWACPHGSFVLDEINDIYCAGCGKDFTD